MKTFDCSKYSLLCALGVMLMTSTAVAQVNTAPSIDRGLVKTSKIKGIEGLDAQLVFLSGDQQVGTIKLGQSLVLPVGRYRARLVQNKRVVATSSFFEVKQTHTYQLPAFYSAVQFDVVNIQGQRVRQPLRIYQRDKTKPMVTTTSFKTNEQPPVFLVGSGEHQLTLGSKRRSTSLDMWFPSGKHLFYRLHVHRGRLLRLERLNRKPSAGAVTETPTGFDVTWRVEGDFALDQGQYGLGVFNGQVLRLGGRSETNVMWRWPKHHIGLGIRFEQSWLGAKRALGDDGLGFEKIVDELQLTARYQWSLTQHLHAYAHAWGRAPVFTTYYQPSAPTSLILGDSRGRTGVIPIGVGERLRLWRPFTPLFTQQALGLRWQPWHDLRGHFALYAGPALRQSMYRGGFFIIDASDRTLQAFRPMDGQYWGAEAGMMLGFHVTQRLHVNAQIDTFWAYDPMIEQRSAKPVLLGTLSAALDLSDFAQLDYRYILNQADFELPRAQQRHVLSLRLIYDIL